VSRVFINAYASHSCVGADSELMQSIYAKKSGVKSDGEYISSKSVAIGKFNDIEFFDALSRATSQLLSSSSLKSFADTLLIVGSSVGGMATSEKVYFATGSYEQIDPALHTISVISDMLDREFKFKQSRSVSTACTSSANALILAHRLIKLGVYRSIVVVGADALCHTTVCGFDSLGVLSSSACRPFDIERDGMNVAEAVAAILLQDEMTDESIELVGCGASSDAFHITNPDPEAKGAIAAMCAALDEAGVDASMVDYINAHGTGTEANDSVEALAISKVFDKTSTYVSSTKAITGHTLGAAGALEAIVSCEVLKQQLIPPQSALKTQQNGDISLLKEPLSSCVKYVLSNSFAFGGNNTSLLFALPQQKSAKVAASKCKNFKIVSSAQIDSPLKIDSLNEKELVPKMMLRRRLTRLARIAIYLADQCSFRDGLIVFGSAYGELKATADITTAIFNKEPISPTSFQNSVYNTAASYLSLLHNNQNEIITISSGLKTSQDLLKTAALQATYHNRAVLIICAEALNIPKIDELDCKIDLLEQGVAILIEPTDDEAEVCNKKGSPHSPSSSLYDMLDIISNKKDGSIISLEL